MIAKVITTAAALLALSPAVTAAPSQPPQAAADMNLTLTTKLRLADSAIDRYLLLPNDEDFIYTFNKDNSPVANAKSFPALVGTGLSATIVDVQPCGMATLHIHPRSAEVLGVSKGRIINEAIPEAGVVDAEGNHRVIRTELGPGQMTVFAAGTFHTSMNPDCETAGIVVAFASEDPGASLIFPEAARLSDDFLVPNVGDALDPQDLNKYRDAIPKSALIMVEECMARCGL